MPTDTATAIGGVLLVNMFVISGAKKLTVPWTCDTKMLSDLLRRKPCDPIVKTLMVGAAIWELVASAVVLSSLFLGTRGGAAGAQSLAAFTVLVTLLFKVRPLRPIALMSNVSVLGGLVLLADALAA